MSSETVSPDAARVPHWVHRFAVFTACATLCLIFVGGLVTSTGSGLAVPDWPLSFGQVFPPMVGGVLYEHGHRLVAAFVGVLTVTLAVLLSNWEPRAWVRRLGWGALAAVLIQGSLGGLTVLLRLPTSVSVTHACLAQVFFCLTVTIAVCTSPRWLASRQVAVETAVPSLRVLTRVTVGLVFVQLILGALMRHTGAGLAIPDFPLSHGRVIPPFESQGVLIHFLHRAGALVVAIAISWTVARVLNAFRSEAQLRRPAMALFALIMLQLTLGALTIWTQRAVTPMTAHVAVGAAVLATSVILALRTARLVGSGASQGHTQTLISEQVTA
ncbi:COX15/CtaA family protein [Candidatus Entotheonella palauensis]|uniref:COX15/CtaA family protein n=1 Tax=Candidatus Entotheonella palauensis TaxID=93172 RepID=UPI000B7F9743|nr:COX15/CtaA family protein [Candidatus Entotheonella palauensis]